MTLVICLSNTLIGQVTADFSVNKTEACEVLSANFIDQSISTAGQIVDWKWTLGSVNSSIQNPSTIFNEIGSYEICLTVTDVNGNENTKCEEDYIKIYKNPTADFSVVENSLCAPATIEFEDLSITDNGNFSSWTWDLGGSTGVLNTSNPNQKIESKYDMDGFYSITLLVEDEKGCTSTESKQGFVEVLRSPSPEFTPIILSNCELPAVVEIDFIEDINPADYSWDFGNGDTYEGPNPPDVVYDTDGKYEITLTSNDGKCESVLIQEVTISTSPDFDINVFDERTCVGKEIIFDLEDIPYDSIYWDIESIGTQVSYGPLAIVFDMHGCFSVSGIIYSGGCTYEFDNPQCIEVSEKPVLDIVVDIEDQCAVPTDLEITYNSSVTATTYWKVTAPNGDFIKTTEQSFTYTANQPGDYEIKLTFAYTSGCLFEYSEIVTLQEFSVLLPTFGPAGCIPLEASLMDSVISSHPISSLKWEVNGDNYFFESTDSIPNFTLSEVGLYDVKLIATNTQGCTDSITISEYAAAGTPPDVDFSYNSDRKCAKFGIEFIDESSDEANSWCWQFGSDSGGSGIRTFYNEDILFYFPDTGYFSVAHVAKFNGCPSDTMVVEDAVYIDGPLSIFEKTYNCDDPYTVNLNNLSIDADSFIWIIYIDNDTIYNSQSSFDFTFPDRGNYLVQLYTENFRTGCDFLKSDTIRIREPLTELTVAENKGCAPFTLDIVDNSLDAVKWKYYTAGAEIDNDTLAVPTIQYLDPGSYIGPKLVITDIHGCQDSIVYDSVFVNGIEAIPIFNEIVCIPDSLFLEDGSVSLHADINSWQWQVGDAYHVSTEENSTYFLDSSAVLDLQLIVEDTWGCIDSFFQEGAINPVINKIDFEYDPVTCSQDAVQFVNLSEGENIIGYSWDFGDGEIGTAKNPKHFYTQEGTYTVCLTIIEERGCQRSICKDNIIEVINPSADFVADVTSIDCPPLLVNFTNNSQEADRYEWNFGDGGGISTEVSPSKVYTSVGNFDVMLIAKRGENCADTLLLEEYINIEGPSGDFTFQTDESCLPLGVKFIGDSDSQYSYTWDFGNGETIVSASNSSTDTIEYMYNETGVYVPKLILENDSGCFRSFSGDPIIVNDISLEFDKHDPYCGTPQMIEIPNNSIASSDPEYSWTINNGTDTYNSNDLDVSMEIIKTGAYNVQLKGSMVNCVDSFSIENAIVIGSIPSVSFNIPDHGLCQFSEIALVNNTTNSFGQITEYEWNFGDGNSSNEVNPTHNFEENQLHVISLMATSEYGCSAEHQKNTEILEAAEIDILPLDPFCRGDFAQVEVNIENPLEGSTISWEASTDLSCDDCIDPILTPQSSTYYTINYIQENGCVQTDSVYAEFFDIEGPQLELTTDNLICTGDSTLVNITNYNPNYNYNWSSDPLLSHLSDDNLSLLVYPDSITQVTVQVTNEQGCLEENTAVVSIETYEDEILVEDKIFCVGDQIILSVESGNDPVWSGDGISCSDCDNPFVTVSSVLTEYTATITSDNGCTFSDTMKIRGVPQNFVNAGDDQSICFGEEIQLDGSALGQASWAESIYLEDINDPKSMATPQQSSYFVYYSSIGDCVDSDSVYIEVLESVDIHARGDTICFQDLANLSVDGNAYEYEWTDLRTNEKLESVKVHELSPEETTPYMVIGTRGLCVSDTQYTEIKVHDQIIVNLEPDYTVYPNKETQVIIDYSGNYDFEWFPHEGLSCWDCPDPIFLITESTEYNLVITDPKSGCELESRLYARYEPECTDEAYFLPNIFSPNGDGQNDEAMVFAENPSEFLKLTIFDRWGEQMYSSEDINEGWDGLFNGEEAMNGVYVMKIDAICEFSRKPYSFYADITLVR